MSEPFTVSTWVTNHIASKAEYARTGGRGRQQIPGWVVVGLFASAEDGQPTCVDYRVRSIPNTHDPVEMQQTIAAVSEALLGQHSGLSSPVVTPGGIPRYVFEQASQVTLLSIARKTVDTSEWYQENLAPGIVASLASGGRRKAGRPPARGLREKLEILEAVERANRDGQSLDVVALERHMSRSSLRDLLYWARKSSFPRLFTNPGQGRRGGQLTVEGRASLEAVRRGDQQ